MPTLTSRSLVLGIDDFEVRCSASNAGLRAYFAVEKDTKQYPNNAMVSVWNLNPKHRGQLEMKQEVTVSIRAGYEENEQQIFLGALRRASTSREGPDLITRLTAGDAEDKLQAATISKSWRKGTPLASIFAEFASAMAVGPGNLLSESSLAKTAAGATLKTGLTIAGQAADEFTDLCASTGFSYSIQDGEIQLLKLDEPVAAGLAVLISPSTGLIGEAKLDIDRKTKKTICVCRSLLQPSLRPGALFKVESERVNGEFACTRSKHYGDTATKEWYVDAEGVAP